MYQKKDYFSPIPSAAPKKKYFFGPPVVQKKIYDFPKPHCNTKKSLVETGP